MRYIVVQDCWRWVRTDDQGKVVEFSDHAYDSPELASDALEVSADRKAHRSAPVEVRHNPQAGV